MPVQIYRCSSRRVIRRRVAVIYMSIFFFHLANFGPSARACILFLCIYRSTRTKCCESSGLAGRELFFVIEYFLLAHMYIYAHIGRNRSKRIARGTWHVIVLQSPSKGSSPSTQLASSSHIRVYIRDFSNFSRCISTLDCNDGITRDKGFSLPASIYVYFDSRAASNIRQNFDRLYFSLKEVENIHIYHCLLLKRAFLFPSDADVYASDGFSRADNVNYNIWWFLVVVRPSGVLGAQHR